MNTSQTIPKCPHCNRRCKKRKLKRLDVKGDKRMYHYGYNVTCGRDECIKASTSFGGRKNIPYTVGKKIPLPSLAFISRCVTCGEIIANSRQIRKHCTKHAHYGRFSSRLAHNSQAMNDHKIDQLKRAEKEREKQEQIRKFRELCNTKLKPKE